MNPTLADAGDAQELIAPFGGGCRETWSLLVRA